MIQSEPPSRHPVDDGNPQRLTNGALMTVDEAAAYIHPTLSPNSIRAMIKDGSLPAAKIGRRYFVHKESCDAVIADIANKRGAIDHNDQMSVVSSTPTSPPSNSGAAAISASLSRLSEMSRKSAPPSRSARRRSPQ